MCRNVLQILEDPTPGYKDLYYKTHQRICHFIQHNAREGHKCIVLTPRGWIKSYIVTIGWSIQRMLKNLVEGKREHEIISNATLPNAKEFLAKIKYNFEHNMFLRGLFGKWIPKDLDNEATRWTQDEIELGGNRIETGSVEGNLVSRHYKIIINDDLVNKENSLTREQIAKVIDWWKLAQSLLLPDGIEIIIGTRWDFDDLYGHAIRTFVEPEKDFSVGHPIAEWHNGNYHLIQMDCWADPQAETGSTFPTMYPEHWLKEQQELQGDRFGGQYRNDPIAKGKQKFKSEHIKRWENLPNIRNTVWLIDPSDTDKEKSDYTGSVFLDYGVDKKFYVIKAERLKITDLSLAIHIVNEAPIFQPTTIGIESNKYNVIRELLELKIPMMIKNGEVPEGYIEYVKTLPYIIEELKHHSRPKFARIEAMHSHVEDGRCLFPHKGAEVLIDELLRLRSAQRDDVADAFGYALDLIHFPKPSDPVKLLVVPDRLKMTDTEREEEDWENYVEDCYADQPQFEDADLY